MEPVKISEIMPKIKVEKELQNKKPEKSMQFAVAKKESSRIPTPMQAMELSLIFNSSPEEKKQRWCQRSLKNDYYIKAAAPTANDPTQPGLVREEDLNTLLACFLLLKHCRAKPNKYTFETTPYQILKFFGGGNEGETCSEKDFTGGDNYKRLKDSLDRLTVNSISTNFWWDMVMGQRIIESSFHFLENVDKGENKALRITLGNKIVESLEKGYVKLLTENSLRGILRLRGHAKVLALFLLKLLGYKPQQDLNLETVLRYLGVEEKYSKLPGHRFNFYISKMIVPAMGKATKAIGIRCTYNKDKQQFHLRRIGSIKRIEGHEKEPFKETGAEKNVQVEGKEERTQDPLLTQRKNEVFKRLASIGVASEMITKLFDEADMEEIERQIEWLPYRKSENPAGILVSAIRGRWIMSAEYEQKREEAVASSRLVE